MYLSQVIGRGHRIQEPSDSTFNALPLNVKPDGSWVRCSATELSLSLCVKTVKKIILLNTEKRRAKTSAHLALHIVLAS